MIHSKRRSHTHTSSTASDLEPSCAQGVSLLSDRRCGTVNRLISTVIIQVQGAPYADRDGVSSAAARVRVSAARVSEAGERVLVSSKEDGRRRAAEDALGARVLVGGEAVDRITRIVVHRPCVSTSVSDEQLGLAEVVTDTARCHHRGSAGCRWHS
jgi:hypothetical protein